MAGPNDFNDSIIQNNVTAAEAKKMAENLETAIETARLAIEGSANVFDSQIKLYQDLKAKYTIEAEELRTSGRDAFMKQQEVKAETKKLEVAVRAKAGYEAIGAVFTDVKGLIENVKKTKKSVNELIGKPLEEALSSLSEFLEPAQMEKFWTVFNKGLSEDPEKAKEELKELATTLGALGHQSVILSALFEQFGLKSYDLADHDIKQLNIQTKVLMNRFFGLRDEGKSFFQLLSKQGKAGLDSVAEAMKSVLTPANLMAAGLSKLFSITRKLVTELDELYAGYSKMGGLIEKDRGGIMGGALEGSISQNRGLGIGKEASFSAGAALQESYSQFSTLNEKARGDLMAITAQLETVGVSAQTTAKLMNIFTKQFGQSVGSAKNDILEMEEYGRSIGVSSSKMMNDMLASMEVLSSFGEKSKQVFKELAKQAKQTGIEVATLVGLEERFMTFDASAELAGKINAMAGRVVLDPMQLMMATGDEKQALIQQAAQSLAIDTNNPRAVKYAANAFGISSADFLKLANPEKDNPEKSATSLQTVVQMSISLGQKLKAILERLAPAVYPFLWALTKILEFLLLITGPLDTFEGKVVLIVLAVGLVIGKLGGLISILGSGIGIFLSAAKGLFAIGKGGLAAGVGLLKTAFGVRAAATAAPAGPGIAAGMVALGEGLMALAIPIAVFGAAALMFAGAFVLFAYGVQVLVKASNEAAASDMAGLGLGLVALGASFIGFAAEMMAASFMMTIAAPAIAGLVALLATLAVTVPAVAPLLSTFASGLIELGDAFRSFMGSMVMETGSGIVNRIKGFFGFKSSGSGLSAFSSTMKTLKDTLGSIPEGAMEAFTGFLKAISEFSFKNSPFAAMVASLEDLIDLLEYFPEEKMFNLTSNMQSLGESSAASADFRGVLEAVGSISSEKVSLVKDVINTAKDYYSSSNEFAKAQSEIPQKQEEATVTLEIDGREVAEAILPLIQGRLAAKYFQDTLYD
jgi:hypothetical protein